jgi:hypothetical protein
VLTLHGKERHACSSASPSTTWCSPPTRCCGATTRLAAQDYHLLILDEAQTVKNAGSQAAQVVRRSRPGIACASPARRWKTTWASCGPSSTSCCRASWATRKSFTRTWRTPIEKHGDTPRRELLAKRRAPFILRRRKEEVATELPPKTDHPAHRGTGRPPARPVRDRAQRHGQAGARSHRRPGLRRSQIVILDALLKLRQVCCDPRLLKTGPPQPVKERAKLDLLMDMLPEMVEEGRRILLFSQFTAMLDLIRVELDRLGIGYVTLTGDTTGPGNPVRRFQEGEVPVFLISLKAGGVGLNLTAADTVIHYDPWWNPAVKTRPPTGPTASARPSRCSSTSSSSPAASRKRSSPSRKGKPTWPGAVAVTKPGRFPLFNSPLCQSPLAGMKGAGGDFNPLALPTAAKSPPTPLYERGKLSAPGRQGTRTDP